MQAEERRESLPEAANVYPAMTRLRLEEGQGLVEYALIIMLVALVVFAALTVFGESVQSLYQTVVNRFRSV